MITTHYNGRQAVKFLAGLSYKRLSLAQKKKFEATNLLNIIIIITTTIIIIVVIIIIIIK